MFEPSFEMNILVFVFLLVLFASTFDINPTLTPCGPRILMIVSLVALFGYVFDRGPFFAVNLKLKTLQDFREECWYCRWQPARSSRPFYVC